MLLSRRSHQSEYTDSPDLPFENVARNYRELGRVNRLLAFADLYTRGLSRWLGQEQCRSLRVLDVGAGDGSLGQAMQSWAQRQGWHWQVTNLDMNPLALRLNRDGRNVQGLVTQLPFADGSFDLVIASQMTHHLNRDEDVIAHFREAWRVTKDAICISDLHRNVGLYGVLRLLLPLLRLSPIMQHDGLLSVKRGWRLPEWHLLAQAACLSSPRVWLYYGSRIVLQARKNPSPHLVSRSQRRSQRNHR